MIKRSFPSMINWAMREGLAEALPARPSLAHCPGYWLKLSRGKKGRAIGQFLLPPPKGRTKTIPHGQTKLKGSVRPVYQSSEIFFTKSLVAC